VEARIVALPGIEELKALWTDVAEDACYSFFISWPWIATWIATIQSLYLPELLLISDGEQLVAVGLLVRRNLRRNVLWASRTLVLNATADAQQDHVFIEYNGLLARRGQESAAWQAWANLLQKTRNWDELQLQGVTPTILKFWMQTDFSINTDQERIVRLIDLNRVKTLGKSFSESLGQSTRRKVRQARKAAEQLGPISVRTAEDVTEAMQFFEEFKRIHNYKWQYTVDGGAFGLEIFERFHRRLIAAHFENGVIQLLKVVAGEHVVGVLYNFVHQNEVLQYQSGINYNLFRSNESPGLLIHALAVEHSAALGYSSYDFLAGDSQYKRSLSNESRSLWWGCVQQNRLKFGVENCLKRTWNYATESMCVLSSQLSSVSRSIRAAAKAHSSKK
jgi:CelD/BcsL family acetyltransferase involved in cellulose biosynthesis